MMRYQLTYASGFFLWFSTTVPGPRPQQEPQRVVTLVVSHDECTTCLDLAVDSGTVAIPLHLRKAYVKNQKKYRQFWELKVSRAKRRHFYHETAYQVSALALSDTAVFNALFLLPGRTVAAYNHSRVDVPPPWDFGRTYRVTGSIIAIKGKYPVFKLQQATLLPNNTKQE